jgi:hypothetical protein
MATGKFIPSFTTTGRCISEKTERLLDTIISNEQLSKIVLVHPF